MPSVALVFKKSKVEIDTIIVDVSLSEQHSSEVEITEHPVEIGTNIVDHARPKPFMLTIEGVVSNDPLPDPSAHTVGHSLPNGEGFAGRSEGQPERATDAYNSLLHLKDDGRLITIVTSLATYGDMMLRSLSVPRDPRTGQTLRFSASFIHVQVVENKVIELKAQPTKKLGKKAAKPVPPEVKKTFAAKVGAATGATKALLGFLSP